MKSSSNFTNIFENLDKFYKVQRNISYYNSLIGNISYIDRAMRNLKTNCIVPNMSPLLQIHSNLKINNFFNFNDRFNHLLSLNKALEVLPKTMNSFSSYINRAMNFDLSNYENILNRINNIIELDIPTLDDYINNADDADDNYDLALSDEEKNKIMQAYDNSVSIIESYNNHPDTPESYKINILFSEKPVVKNISAALAMIYYLVSILSLISNMAGNITININNIQVIEAPAQIDH